MVKTLMKQIKEYKKDSLLTMLFATLEVVLEIMIPLLMNIYKPSLMLLINLSEILINALISSSDKSLINC